MKTFIILAAIGLVATAMLGGGCKAYDSLIGHPLHVLHQQHEEAEKINQQSKTNKP